MDRQLEPLAALILLSVDLRVCQVVSHLKCKLLLIRAFLVAGCPGRMSGLEHGRHLLFLVVEPRQHLTTGHVDARARLPKHLRPALDHLLDRLVRLVISRAKTVVSVVDRVPRVGALSGDSLVCRQFLQCSLGRIQSGLRGQLPGVHTEWRHICLNLISSDLLVLHACRRVNNSRRIDRGRAL